MNYTQEQIKQYKEEIKILITNFPKSYYFIIQKKQYLLDFINEETSWIDAKNTDIKLSGRIFFLLNDIKEFPKCEMCGKALIKSMKANKTIKDYIRHCSLKCANSNPLSKERLRETNMKKYGVPISSQSIQAKEKYKKKMEMKYGPGIFNAFQAREVINKLEETKLEKYGSKYYNNREKSEQTCIKKYGVRVSSQAKEVIDKNIRKHQYLLDDIKFDSAWEAAYYIWLRDNKIEFQYHPKSIKYFDKYGKSHWYHPDFLVNGKLIEIKGNDQFKNGVLIDKLDPTKNYLAYAKQKCMIENNVIILMKNEMNKYFSYIKCRYGNPYKHLKQFKINK